MTSRTKRVSREAVLRRRPPSRSPKRKFVLLVEGTKTETGYFSYFDQVRNATVKVDVLEKGAVPMTLLERAKGVRADYELDDFDEIWIVCDVDEHPRLDEVVQKAKESKVELCISSPCFELWLYLHFESQTTQVHRKQLQTTTRRLSGASQLPQLRKALTLQHFVNLANGYGNAAQRQLDFPV